MLRLRTSNISWNMFNKLFSQTWQPNNLQIIFINTSFHRESYRSISPADMENEKNHLGRSTSKDQNDSFSSQISDSPKAWEQPGHKAKALRIKRNIQRYIWDDPDKPAIEKKFLRKLDFFLLTYTCLGYFCKNLDQANISNAYVSGMKESLNMQGSQLTYMGNVFTAGYVVGQIPAVILVTRVRPSILVSSLEVLWAIFTFCCAAVRTVPQLYAMRFLIGLCEGAFFPVIIYLISSWCKSSSDFEIDTA